MQQEYHWISSEAKLSRSEGWLELSLWCWMPPRIRSLSADAKKPLLWPKCRCPKSNHRTRNCVCWWPPWSWLGKGTSRERHCRSLSFAPNEFYTDLWVSSCSHWVLQPLLYAQRNAGALVSSYKILAISETRPPAFLIYGSEHAFIMQRFSWWLWQCV